MLTPSGARRSSAWTTRRWLRVGVAASLTVLALLGVTGAWVLGRTASISEELVDVRVPALTTSFRLESALLNQETGIRGYGLTGTPEFLQPYQQGLTDQDVYAVELARLLDGDGRALADLKALQDAVSTWQERIARPIAASPSGAPSPLATARAAEAKTSFDALRQAMAGQQEQLLAERTGPEPISPPP